MSKKKISKKNIKNLEKYLSNKSDIFEDKKDKFVSDFY